METKIELIKHSHSVGESNFHYQITPAYRRPIFRIERVRKLVKAYLLSKAKELNVIIVKENVAKKIGKEKPTK